MPNHYFKGTNLVNERGIEERMQNRSKNYVNLFYKTSYNGCNTSEETLSSLHFKFLAAPQMREVCSAFEKAQSSKSL